MTITVKEKTDLVVPRSVRRQAGIKAGDRLQFQASPRTITIRAEPPTYKPTKSEWAAIRKGEAAIARGDCVLLAEFLHDLDRRRRKARPKASQKVSR